MGAEGFHGLRGGLRVGGVTLVAAAELPSVGVALVVHGPRPGEWFEFVVREAPGRVDGRSGVEVTPGVAATRAAPARHARVADLAALSEVEQRVGSALGLRRRRVMVLRVVAVAAVVGEVAHLRVPSSLL